MSKAVLQLGERMALYRGLLPDLPLHAYGAPALLMSLEDDLRLAPATQASARGWLVQAGFDHRAYYGNGLSAVAFFEPDTPLARSLHHHLHHEQVRPLSSRVAASVQACLQREEPGLSWLEALVDGLQQGDRLQRIDLDPRVAEVCRQLRLATPGEQPRGLALARAVELSEPRLQHLFKDETGIAIGVFRTVLRMRAAAREIAQGASLTDAAHASGFSDSAHFSRRFRKMFGLKPSAVFRQLAPAAIVEAEQDCDWI